MDIAILSSVFNFIASVICFIATGKMFFVIRDKKKESVSIRYYFYALLFISVYLFIGGLPMIVIKDPYFAIVFVSFFRPVLLIGAMFLTLIPINLSKLKIIDSLYVYGTVVIIFLSSILTIFGIRDMKSIVFTGNIGDWMRPDDSLIITGMIIVGIYFSLSLLSATIYFFKFSMKQKENKVAFGKSLMMTIGCFMFFGAGVFNYIIGLSANIFVTTSIIASILFMIGSIAFISSVTYKGDTSNIKKKKPYTDN